MYKIHIITWTHDNTSTGQAVFEPCTKPFGHVALELPLKSEPAKGYVRDSESGGRDCIYTALGISRQNATQLLLDNIGNISSIIKTAVRKALSDIEEFYQYLISRNIINISHDQLILNHTLLTQYASDLKIQSAYIQYDVKDRCIDAGYSHPSVLQAIEHICHIELHIWRLGERNVLIPHNARKENYTVHTPEYIRSRVDLLFVSDHYFEKLEIVGYEGNIPAKDIYPLNSSCNEKKLYISLWKDGTNIFTSREHNYETAAGGVSIYEVEIDESDLKNIWQALDETFLKNYKTISESINQKYFGDPDEINGEYRPNKHAQSLLRPSTNNIVYKFYALVDGSQTEPREENCTSLVFNILKSINIDITSQNENCFSNHFYFAVLILIAFADSVGFGYSVGDTVRAGMASDEVSRALPLWLVFFPIIPCLLSSILACIRLGFCVNDNTYFLGEQRGLIFLMIFQLFLTIGVAIAEGLDKISKSFTDSSSKLALGVGITIGVFLGILDFTFLVSQIYFPLIHRPPLLNNKIRLFSKKFDVKETIAFFKIWFPCLDEDEIKEHLGLDKVVPGKDAVDNCESGTAGIKMNTITSTYATFHKHLNCDSPIRHNCQDSYSQSDYQEYSSPGKAKKNNFSFSASK